MLLFKKKKDIVLEMLDEAITDCFKEMQGLNSDSDEYGEMNKNVQKLIATRSELTSKRRVSPDTIALILANLAGIVLILGYERAGVIASKALGFVSKLRL